jgi:hypothetical protein
MAIADPSLDPRGNSMHALLRGAAAVAVFIAACAPASGAREPLAPKDVAVNQLLLDTQKSSPATDTLDLVWWIPPQFWETILADDAASPDASEEIVELFGQYTVFAVVHGKVGNFGASKFLDADAIRADIRFVDIHGREHVPLEPAAVDERLGVIAQMIKPLLSNLIGQLGANLQFIVFPARDADGRALADPLGDGPIAVTLKGQQYAFRLPLGSLLPARRDRTSGETFPGSYDFNPYTGAALEASPAQ